MTSSNNFSITSRSSINIADFDVVNHVEGLEEKEKKVTMSLSCWIEVHSGNVKWISKIKGYEGGGVGKNGYRKDIDLFACHGVGDSLGTWFTYLPKVLSLVWFDFIIKFETPNSSTMVHIYNNLLYDDHNNVVI